MPASFELDTVLPSGSARLAATSPFEIGWHAHCGCALYVAEEGLNSSGLIHRPSRIGAMALRTAAKVASG